MVCSLFLDRSNVLSSGKAASDSLEMLVIWLLANTKCFRPLRPMNFGITSNKFRFNELKPNVKFN